MTKNNFTPSVFISYSWTSMDHENWVMDLARRLRRDGVNAVIDKWRLKAGHDRFAFMEEMIGSEDIHKVLVICDKGYKEKANQRIGGVGIETQVITNSIYTRVKQEKFIPILAERGEDGAECIPTFMSSLIYIDLSSASCYETGYKQLLYTIYETAEHEEPELGNIPEFILQNKVGLQEDAEFSEGDQNKPIVEFYEHKFRSDDTNHKHSIKNVNLTAFWLNLKISA
ncbi:toll/interleukin-1 receptor domain-containing protein [Cohnella sp. LGH]|uniref:toll/interleukin-1 receptor domain-containing protein n=1 Tax=Cohnella sp. LGH TaxID=1619153 RepID=UPI001ADD576C|nr:toll/interleukin-1 receptor domain-containing protein [Cohnella sp. LGH]QTH42033.1 toll/interleukin-1 receptor domain-containing protein [Cohnella sp. LGH]